MLRLFMKIKKHLSFGALIESFSGILKRISDHRENGKVEYSIGNVFMSAFAMMFFQNSSLVEFQRNMETQHHRNNIRVLIINIIFPDWETLLTYLLKPPGIYLKSVIKP